MFLSPDKNAILADVHVIIGHYPDKSGCRVK